MKTVAFHTLGCKVNAYESIAMKQLFLDAGYQEVDFKERADVYVVNTCTVTGTGDQKSRQMLRRAHRTNPEACVVAVGCYSQTASQEVAKIPGVSVVLGTQKRDQIVAYVTRFEKDHEVINTVTPLVNRYEDLKVRDYADNTRAFLKIQDGCNNFCTYCAIPYARGRMRSRPRQSVLRQAQMLVDEGYPEIVLTGIHTAGYGIDFDDYDFGDLLYDLCREVKGLKRLRISSIEASQITDKIITLLESEDKIAKHLHVPLQSGSDTVLKRMNRRYTTEEFYDTMTKVRKRAGDIALTTDVIAGFPQESEEEFQETVDFVKKAGFSRLHVFPYSPRQGTPAADMPGQIPEHIKKQRVRILMACSAELYEKRALSRLGQSAQVIFEKKDKDGSVTGYSEDYLHVKGFDQPLGVISAVRLEKYEKPFLIAKSL